MALKNRANTATYEFDGDEITLQANFKALESLSEATGVDGLIYIQTMKTIRDIVEVFYHLQFGTKYTREDIHNAFFTQLAEFNKEENTNKFGSLVATILGADKNEALEKLSAGQDTPKK